MQIDTRALDHFYHRSRVDAHIGGSITFILVMLALTVLVGDKFQPFQQGADLWSATLLVWQPDTSAWVPVKEHWGSGGLSPMSSSGPAITKEIYPRCYSLVVVIGILAAAFFLYGCARRQSYLMLAVYGENDPDRPYDRPWEEIRITFWALFLVLLGTLFLFLM